jgi:hypothetical protein
MFTYRHTSDHTSCNKMWTFTWLISLFMVAEAGEVLWSGFFNESATVAEFDNCKLVAKITGVWL